MFKNLRELVTAMPTEKDCREYLAQQRWPDNKVICPYCGYSGKIYKIQERDRYKCGNKECYKKFSVTVGTIFEASNIQLTKWFMAIYLCTAHKKGISSYQLAKDIGTSQKCAWFMLHRIRELMRVKTETKLENTVEVDEVYIGGKVGNMSKTKRKYLRENGLTLKTKTLVMGMVERDGNLKLIALGKDNGTNVLQPIVRNNVSQDSVVITDGLQSYVGLDKTFAAHQTVNHEQDEFVKDSIIHTNTIEGAFSHFKRSIYGIYHQISTKHLSRYCDETMFRYNLRKMNDCERFNFSLANVDGRLDYKTLVDKTKGNGYDQITFEPITVMGKKQKRAVVQLKDGVVINQFESISEAARQTNCKQQSIQRVLKGIKNTTNGFGWKYTN